MVIDTPEKVTSTRGAAICVTRYMRRSLDLALTNEQATALWAECRAFLLKLGARKMVREIESADEGVLDTYVREFLMDAIGQVLTGMDWPLNMTSQAESNRFVLAIRAAVQSRGYAPAV
jgi:hypothetical protein